MTCDVLRGHPDSLIFSLICSFQTAFYVYIHTSVAFIRI